MSIRFICTCGKHLRARDEMAARRSVCPRCGQPVGIPSPHANQRGTSAGPLSPEERQRAQSSAAKKSPADGIPTIVIPFVNDPLRDPTTGPPPYSGPLTYRVVELPVDDKANGPARAARPDAEEPPRSRREQKPTEDKDAAERALVADVLGRLVRKDFQRPPRRRRRWPLETHWYECLCVPLRNWGWEVFLALILSLATAFVFKGGSELFEGPGFALLIGWSLVGLVPLALIGTYLQWVLAAAAVGAPPDIRFRERESGQVIPGTARWLVCLLAGPVPLLLLGIYYWIWCGDLDLLDWLILAELSFGAVGYGLFALLAVTRSERLRDANPVQVAELVRALGVRAAAFAVAAWLLVLVHGWLLLSVIQDDLQQPGSQFSGWLLLTLSWFSALCCATFLLRLLGLSSFRRLGPLQSAAARDSEHAE
jgi:hypothetical protein